MDIYSASIVDSIVYYKQIRPNKKAFRLYRNENSQELKELFKLAKNDFALKQLINREYIYTNEKPLFMTEMEIDTVDSSLVCLLTWGKYLISFYADILNEYIKYKGLYEKSLFAENYDSAYSLVNKIEKRCSYSMWGIQQKLIISSLSKNKYNNLLKKEYQGNKYNLSGVLLSYYEKMTDSSISFEQYNNTIKEILSTIDSSKTEWKYFFYKLDIVNKKETSEYKVALALDEQLSIIDYYETYIDILQRLFNRKGLFNYIGDIIQSLDGIIRDFRLTNMRISYLGKFSINDYYESKSAIELIENYSKGIYEEILKKQHSYLNEYINDFNIICLCVKSGVKVS
ncbi:MAG: hypothetical protein K6E79_08160, partial [Pseudobutyrivibrio sp.]|nr:hypothetical protein [Pseudobutyrivibrio sp.]